MKVLLLSGQIIGVLMASLAPSVPPALNQHMEMQIFHKLHCAEWAFFILYKYFQEFFRLEQIVKLCLQSKIIPLC
jgi:hypothetical protein